MTIVNPSPVATRTSRLLTAGHSVTVEGGGASNPNYAAFVKLGGLVGASRVDMLGKGGAILCCQESALIASSARYGGIGRLLQFGGAIPARTSAPYPAAVALAAIMWGENDLAWMGPTTFQTAFPHGLRSAIARLRAGRVFEDTDASVAYTGASWGNIAYTLVNSGTQVKSVGTNGDSFTITVPADFPGGTIALRFATNNNGGGVLWTIAGTGSCAGVSTTLDTRNIIGFSNGGTIGANGAQTSAVKRLTGLPAGAGTITVTATTVVTIGYFDCWEIESPNPGLVALPLAFRSPSYSLFSTWPYQPVDADITTVNNVIQSVANEFDSSVFTVPTDDLLAKNSVYFQNNSASDNLHPNDQGHGLLAGRLAASIRAQAAPAQIAQPTVNEARWWKNFGDATGDVAYSNSWVDFGAPHPPGGVTIDWLTNRVTIRGCVKKTTGSATDPIVTLGAGLRPSNTMFFSVPVFNGASWGMGSLTIDSSGNVALNNGGSIAVNSGNVINCTFLAEQ